MRLVFLVLVWAFSALNIFAQNIGNEWINYAQSYLKIKVDTAGFHRISFTELQQTGFPVANTPSGHLRLYYRGKEQSIITEGLNDALPLIQGQGIIFYGKPNTGAHESILYGKPEWQPHPFANLHSDTASYFLTAAPTAGGKRIVSGPGNAPGIGTLTTLTQVYRSVYKSEYSLGRGYFDLGSRIHHSFFDVGEGWTNRAAGNFQNISIKANAPFVPQANGNLRLVIAGRNGRPHRLRVSIGSGAAARNLDTLFFDRYNTITVNYSITSADIADGTLSVSVSTLGTTGFPDQFSISLAELSYNTPLTALTGNQLMLNNLAAGQYRLNFNNLPVNSQIFDITNPDSIVRLQVLVPQPSANNYTDFQAIINKEIPGTAELALFNQAGIINIPAAQLEWKGRYRNYDPSRADYIIITHPVLRKPTGTTGDPITAFAQYRKSTAGGNHDTLIVETPQLYDQFNYGEPSPLAIRKFIEWVNRVGNPKFITLIGKGLHIRSRNEPGFSSLNQVPALGVPASDLLYTSELNSSGVAPAIAIGRISASTPAQVRQYLNKVIEHEATPYNSLWRKNFLHLSGGRTVSEQEQFRGYLAAHAQIAQARLMGAKVKSFNRQANSIVEFIDVVDVINEGTSVVNIFGHSSIQGADIDIGRPGEQSYRNKGRYPLISINGCYAGNLFETSFSVNEDWVLSADRGAIAFMANVDEGLPSRMNLFIRNWYQTMFADSAFFGKPIGTIHKEFVKDYLQGQISSFDTILAEQMTLHADPALVLFGPKAPDYSITDQSLRVLTAAPTAAMANIQIQAIVSNFGQVPKDSMIIGIWRILPDNSRILVGPYKFRQVFNSDTLVLDIPRPVQPAGGLNRFEVIVDFYDSIRELNETNNRAILELNLPTSGINILAPANNSIISSQPVSFIVQMSAAAQNRLIRFEIDTTPAFNSTALRTGTASGQNIVVYSTSLFSRQDSLVYFWRCRFQDRQAPNDTAYERGSFTYIENAPEGWSQGNFYQTATSTPLDLSVNYNTKNWSFIPRSATITCVTSGSSLPQFNSAFNDISINGTSIFAGTSSTCWNGDNVNGRLLGIRFDRNTLRAYPFYWNPAGAAQYWRSLCGREPMSVTFIPNWLVNAQIPSTSIFTDDMIRQMKPGDYMLLTNMGKVDFKNWRVFQRRALATIGADTNQFKAVGNGHPYIILGRRAPTYAGPGGQRVAEAFSPPTSDSTSQTISISATLNGNITSGTLTSQLIGPAAEWQTARVFVKSNPEDYYGWDIIAQTLTGEDSVVATKLRSQVLDISGLNAKRFPYVYLRVTLTDSISATPPQLKKWEVYFRSVPELIINQNLAGINFNNINDKPEGTVFSFKTGFQNITARGFDDSLTVLVNIRHQDGRRPVSQTFKIRPIRGRDTATLLIPQINTLGRGGNNSIQVYINPRILPEQQYGNNIADIPFKVIADKTNPILDVAIDGKKVMDGDLVSPNPTLLISLKDENRLIRKTDTSGIDLYFQKSCPDCKKERISLSNQEVRFTPAQGNTPLQIEYKPGKLDDGTHTLFINAPDAAGNKAGGKEYRLSFKVENEASVTRFYPYPNPFSTQTRFVFTLSGAEVPDEILIRISTVSGRVVKEIKGSDLGPIRIGNNISQYAWDGTDQYGDKLANGVYFYYVIIKSRGQEIKHRATAGDDTFQNGIGKIYILR